MRLLHSPGRIPLISELGLIVLLAWMVSGWLLPGERTESPGLMQDAAGPAVILPDLTSLLAVPLFGKPAPKAKPAAKPVAQKTKSVVQSRLNIKLLGTVVAGDHSAAIISLAASSEQQAVFIGDTIQPGVKLFAVEAEAIVVERGGMLERVSLEQSEKLSSSPLSATDSAYMGASTMVPASAVGTSAINTATGSAATSGVTRQVDRVTLQKKISDFPALMSEARLVPHFVDGKSDGFVISDIVIGSLYQQVGLQNGDIIRKVNGKQVTSAQQAMDMYRALESATSIDLELMRAGQVQQVHYDIH